MIKLVFGDLLSMSFRHFNIGIVFLLDRLRLCSLVDSVVIPEGTFWIRSCPYCDSIVYRMLDSHFDGEENYFLENSDPLKNNTRLKLKKDFFPPTDAGGFLHFKQLGSNFCSCCLYIPNNNMLNGRTWDWNFTPTAGLSAMYANEDTLSVQTS